MEESKTVGRYRLDRLLGKGGMAEVYRAYDTVLERTVAVKMILPVFAAEPTFVERFLREARLVAALVHPNILPVYDFGEHEGAPYLVLPCMDRGTLATRVGLSPQPPPVAVDWMRQLAEALDTAHAAGVLHRDIKPSNVLMDRSDRPVLADFGLARMLDAASDLTASGVMVGTPLYMAPELAQGQPATKATDLYALGVLGYQMLSGTTPFSGESPVAVLHQQVSRPVPRIEAFAPGLPGEVGEVFERALAKEPDQRFATARELAEAIGRSLGGVFNRPFAAAAWAAVPVSGSRAGPAVGSGSLFADRGRRTPLPPALSEPADVEAHPVPGRSNRSFVLGGLALLTALVIAAIVATSIAQRGDGRASPVEAVRPGPTSGALAEPGEDRGDVAPREVESGTALPNESREPPPRIPSESEGGPEAPSTRSTETSAVRGTSSRVGAEGALRRLGQQFRRPRRLGEDDFRALHETLAPLLEARPDQPTLQAMNAFAEGGTAYAAGDDAAAREAVSRARDAIPASMDRGQLPLWLAERADASGLPDWELAVIFGDARGEGLALAERRLAEAPGDVRASMGRAMLLHVNDRHQQAIAQAEAVRSRLGQDDEIAGYVGLFIGDEQAELERWPEAVAAYRIAAQGGGRPAAYAGMEGGRIALERLQDPAAAQELFQAACDAGQTQACRRGVMALRDRPRRR